MPEGAAERVDPGRTPLPIDCHRSGFRVSGQPGACPVASGRVGDGELRRGAASGGTPRRRLRARRSRVRRGWAAWKLNSSSPQGQRRLTQQRAIMTAARVCQSSTRCLGGLPPGEANCDAIGPQGGVEPRGVGLARIQVDHEVQLGARADCAVGTDGAHVVGAWSRSVFAVKDTVGSDWPARRRGSPHTEPFGAGRPPGAARRRQKIRRARLSPGAQRRAASSSPVTRTQAARGLLRTRGRKPVRMGRSVDSRSTSGGQQHDAASCRTCFSTSAGAPLS